MPTILLSNNTIKGYAGSELVTLDLATEFKHRGYDVTIATFGKDTDGVKGLDALDVKWLDLNIQQPNVENIVFDLIWAHHFTTLDAILMDIEITAKAIIFSSMSPYEPLESPPTYASQLSLVLANSEETKNQLLHYGLPSSMVHVFPNPVAREWFTFAKVAASLPLRKVAIVSNHVVRELQDAIKHLQALGFLVEVFGVEYNFQQVTPTLLASFDCVVTIGRTVQQAMVLGLPVYCYDRFGGPGFLRTENFEKAGLFNYSGRCCGFFKTAEEIATELVDGYQSAVISAPELQLIAYEKYRLDFAVSQVLELIADNTLDLSIVSTALKLPLRMRKHAKNSESNQLFAQLFLDNGSGFSESTSIRIPLNGIQASQCSHELVFDLPDNHSLVNIRLDPLNVCAVITIHRVELLGPEGSVNLTDCIKTNAKANTNNNHFFIDDDPQIFFEDTNFIRATHLKVSLTYQATGSEALKEFITQHEARFPSSISVTDSEQSYSQISQQVIEQYAKSIAPIKEELIARIHEIASLNQQTRKRDEEISSINQANTEREQVHLAQLSQARQQIEDQLLQLAEREKTSSVQLQQLQQAHEQQKSEQSREHAERERAHLAELGKARNQIEAQLLQLVEREKASSEQLQQLQQAHKKQTYEQIRGHAEREQAYLLEIGQARQQIEGQLLQLAVREKSSSEQLQQLQQAHKKQTNEQIREYAVREKNQLSQLALARQHSDAYMLELAEREKTYGQHLQAICQTHEQQKHALSHKHAEQEKAHLAQLALARQKLEAHLLKLAEREKKFSQQLQAIRQTSDQRKREHTIHLAERDKTLSRQLQEIQQAHAQQKNEQNHEHAGRELALLAQINKAREQIEAHLLELATREKAFSTELQAMHLTHEQQKNAQDQQHAERVQAHIAQLTVARQQIEAHLLQLAEREKAFSEQLQKVQQTHEQQTSTLNQQQAEREQALNEQLTAKQHELHSQLNSWAEIEKAHALAVNELHRELDFIRSTLSWRWTTPLRSLAALLRQQNADTSQTTVRPAANEMPVNDQLTNLTAHMTETPTTFSPPSSNTNTRIFDMTLSHTGTAARTLEELLSYHDEKFIHSAYQTLLGRAPDPEGMRYYLARVRAGVNKIEIAAQLSQGVEGKNCKTKIAGLDKVIRKHKQLKKPLLGPILRFIGIRQIEGNLMQKVHAIENRIYVQHIQLQENFRSIEDKLAIQYKQVQKIFIDTNNTLSQLMELVESKEYFAVKQNEKNLSIQFDADWYLEEYLDVAKSGMDPYLHYLKYGEAEGRLPLLDSVAPTDNSQMVRIDTPVLVNIDDDYSSIKFDSEWYLGRYPDVVKSGMEPFQHYLQHGKSEGRLPVMDNALLFDNGQMLLIDALPQATHAQGRIAIHLHMYYHDLADEFSKYLNNMPFEYDLYVSVAHPEGIEFCRKAFSNIPTQRLLTIEQVPNRGRDIAPMFCTFGSRLKDYDYIAHFHSKKSLYNKGATNGWREYLCGNLLGSEARIRRVFDLMQGNAPRGIVYPQNYMLLPYQAYTWLANKGEGSAWCARLGISKVPQGYFDFPAGSMFWAKGDALKPLFDTGIILSDFPEESGQTDGTFAHCLERLLVLCSLKQGYKPGIIKDLQHPTWSAWAFHQYTGRTFQFMVNQLKSPTTKLLAFDIFDTLVCRPLLDPESMKAIVAERTGGETGQLYMQYRAIAEGQARELAGKDVGMTDIFARLGKLTAFPEKMLAQLRSLEEDLEIESVEPRAGGLDLYREALTTGKPVVLISDMFLPRKVIEEILKRNGITGWNKLFLSNEIGVRKDGGKLYEYVFSHYNITPAEMLMVGDNERSDLQIPCDMGVVGVHLLKPIEFARGLPRFQPLIEANEGSGDLNRELTLGLILKQNFSAICYPQLDPSSLVNPTPFNAGYSLIGPLLVGLAQWLVESARSDKIDRLYFLSREGQLIKRVYDVWTEGLEELPQAEYLVLSRRAVSVPMIKSFEDILNISKATYFPNTISNFLFERYGLTLNANRWAQLTQQTEWSSNSTVEIYDQKIDCLLPLLHLLESEIIAEANLERGALEHYLSAMGVKKTGRQAVVDVGYGGTIQDYLNRLVSTPVHGYYMMTDQRSSSVAEKHNVFIRGCYMENTPHDITSPLMYLRSFELEKFLSSNEAQVVNYKLDHKNNLSAHHRKLSNEETGCFNFRNELQEGVIQYALDARSIRNRILPSFKPSCVIAKQMYEAFIMQPSQMETDLLQQVVLDDYYSGRGLVR